MTDIVRQTLSHPPVDTRYVAGLWHPSRVSLEGVVTEARVFASSLLKTQNPEVRKFLILSRARSGSTLLTQLLKAHPDITCEREVLGLRVLAARSYLNRLAEKATTRAYGAKLLSYQMIQVQRFRDPVGFLNRLADDGFRFIHIERNSFAQTLSLYMAQTSRIYHQGDGSGTGRKIWEHGDKTRTPRAAVEIDVADFIRRLDWTRMLLDYERHCLKDLPHLKVSYEADLADASAHQGVADRAYDWIGMPPAPEPVAGGIKKILPSDPRQVIANYAALADGLRRSGLAHMLPD
jgi:hypothetical protein